MVKSGPDRSGMVINPPKATVWFGCQLVTPCCSGASLRLEDPETGPKISCLPKTTPTGNTDIRPGALSYREAVYSSNSRAIGMFIVICLVIIRAAPWSLSRMPLYISDRYIIWYSRLAAPHPRTNLPVWPVRRRIMKIFSTNYRAKQTFYQKRGDRGLCKSDWAPRKISRQRQP